MDEFEIFDVCDEENWCGMLLFIIVVVVFVLFVGVVWSVFNQGVCECDEVLCLLVEVEFYCECLVDLGGEEMLDINLDVYNWLIGDNDDVEDVLLCLAVEELLEDI